MKLAYLAMLVSAATLVMAACNDDSGSPTAAASTVAALATDPAGPPAALIPPSDAVNPPPAAAYAGCMDDTVAGSYEELRLANVLPGNNSTPFADQILTASGFDGYGPTFRAQLCTDRAIRSFGDAVRPSRLPDRNSGKRPSTACRGAMSWARCPKATIACCTGRA